MREAVFQQGVLLAEGLVAVRADEAAQALTLMVALERLLAGEFAATRVTDKYASLGAPVPFDVLLTLFPVGEHKLAQVTLVELLFKVCGFEVPP